MVVAIFYKIFIREWKLLSIDVSLAPYHLAFTSERDVDDEGTLRTRGCRDNDWLVPESWIEHEVIAGYQR